MDIEKFRKNFSQKITVLPSGCHVWTGACRKRYGLVWVDGRMKQATHAAWFLQHGVWPEQHVLHRCDNPPCANAAHLFEGDDQDNADDRNAKGRHSYKLDYLAERELLALADRMPDWQAADRFGVHVASIVQLRARRGVTKDRRGARFAVGVEWLTVEQISERAGVSYGTIRARLDNGLTGEQLLAGRYAGLRKTPTRKT